MALQKFAWHQKYRCLNAAAPRLSRCERASIAAPYAAPAKRLSRAGGQWGAPLRQNYSAFSDLVFVRLQLLFEALLGDLLLLLFGCRLGPAGKRHCLRNAMITTARAWRGLLRTVLEGCTSFVQPTAQHLDLHAAENCGQQPGPTDRLDIITESSVHALTS